MTEKVCVYVHTNNVGKSSQMTLLSDQYGIR
jgi:hypothetical protein